MTLQCNRLYLRHDFQERVIMSSTNTDVHTHTYVHINTAVTHRTFSLIDISNTSSEYFKVSLSFFATDFDRSSDFILFPFKSIASSFDPCNSSLPASDISFVSLFEDCLVLSDFTLEVSDCDSMFLLSWITLCLGTVFTLIVVYCEVNQLNIHR